MNQKKSRLHLIRILAIAFSSMSIISAQIGTTTPFNLSLALESSESTPTLVVETKNISGHNQKLLEGKPGMAMRNLIFVVLAEGEDTLFIDVDETIGTEMGNGNGVGLTVLKPGESVTAEIDLFSGNYGIGYDSAKRYEVRAILQSVFRSRGPNQPDDVRSQVWPWDIVSNLLVIP